MDIDWGPVVSGLISTIGTGAVSFLGNEQKNEQQQALWDREDAIRAEDLQREREAAALELRLQALKAAYGGGGGGGGPFTGITDAQKVGAIQAQGELKQDSIKSALTALQNAYGLGVRY